MKVYEIFLTDIWNNNYLIGFFKDLDDATDKINSFIANEKFYLHKGDIKEYPSTFEHCFDVSVGDIYLTKHPESNEDFYCDDMDLYIRGFILDKEELLKNLKTIEG